MTPAPVIIKLTWAGHQVNVPEPCHCWFLNRDLKYHLCMYPCLCQFQQFGGGGGFYFFQSHKNFPKLFVSLVDSFRPRQNNRQYPNDIFKCIFLTENVTMPITISLKFVPKDPINNILALAQTMAWCRRGDKPLSEPMMFRLPTDICHAASMS